MTFLFQLLAATLASSQVPDAAPAAIVAAPPAISAGTAVAAAAPATPDDVIPALTDITVAVDEEISTKTAKTGTEFALHLAEPIVIRGIEVVPAGTPGTGEIIHAATSRSMGKAGELVLAARFLDYDGRRIALRSMKLGRHGKDNTNLAFAVNIAAGMAIFFVTGGEVVVPAGTIAAARTAAAFPLPPALAARLAALPPLAAPAPEAVSSPASSAPPASVSAPH